MYLRVSVLMIALISGTLLTQIPALCLSLLVFAASILCALQTRQRSLLASGLLTACAVLYGSDYVDRQLQHRLPLDANASEFRFTGCVSGLPQEIRSPLTGRTYFKSEFVPDENRLSPAGLRRLSLNWYQPDITLAAGDCYEVTAVLRSPRNLANGLPFDYEAYLIFRGVDAGGYVRDAERMTGGQPPSARDRLLQQVSSSVPEPASVWIRGLLFGDGAAFTQERWRLVRDTGTLHLLVVSGLHVGLMAFAGFWAGRVLQRLLVIWSGGRYAQRVSLLPQITALMAATGYLFLAGTGIPLLRAWLMAAAGVFLLASARRFRPTLLILLAAPAVLLLNPMAWTQAGFWYSFAAVLALIASFRGRSNGWVLPWFLPQLVVFLMLLPVMMFWGQPVSLVHIVANVIAVPVLSILLLPLAFFCLLFPHPWIISALSVTDRMFWQTLEQVSGLPVPVLYDPGPAVLGCWLLLMGLFIAGAHLRMVLPGVILLLMLMMRAPEQDSGIWLFDSGQGQSLLVTDARKTVLIDTGPRFSPSFSIAEAVVIPWLRKAGVEALDLLVISHSDHDHSGGAGVLMEQFPVRALLAGQPDTLSGSQSCHGQGRKRVSESVTLVFYSVPENLRTTDNDTSCVVQIHWFGKTLLVPGDLSSDAERQLILRYGRQLRSDVLVAGHHGSNTSTSAAWLRAVQPDQVWISAGFDNRFGHPHADVLERINVVGITPLVTAQSGLIRLDDEGRVVSARSGWQPPWRQP